MFWIIFVIVPIIILALFSWKKPAMAPWAIIICPVINLIFFFREFMYYEARGFLLFLLSRTEGKLPSIKDFLFLFLVSLQETGALRRKRK